MRRFFALLLVLLVAGCSSRADGPALPSAPEGPSFSSSPAPEGGPSSEPPPAPRPEPEPPPEPVIPDPPVSQPEQPAPAVPDPLDEVLDGEPQGEDIHQPPEGTEETEGGSADTSASSSPPAPANNSGESRTFWEIREDMVKNAAAFREQNPDTVGWLYIYETTVDSPVFQRVDDNNYYLKHNDYQKEDVNGAIVSDFRNRLTGRDSQSQNLVLYAHSKDENPDGGVEASREFEHFTELKRYQSKDFCMAHPYFLFATGEESTVFEIFAAFHTKTSFVYNTPNPSRSQMEDILAEAKKKSLFDFGVKVTADDRIMTLSTCCRRIVPTYPNGYRFVIMGRLVEKGRVLNYDRTVTENPTALAPWNIYE